MFRLERRLVVTVRPVASSWCKALDPVARALDESQAHCVLQRRLALVLLKSTTLAHSLSLPPSNKQNPECPTHLRAAAMCVRAAARCVHCLPARVPHHQQPHPSPTPDQSPGTEQRQAVPRAST
jgi:hypothetical protein